MMVRKNIFGFTLVEVLVAIAVIAFTVPAVLLLMSKQADYAGTLRDKTIAQWIAQNQMVELHHNHTFFNVLPQREQVNTISMADREWRSKLDINKAEIWSKYTVTVSLDNDNPIIVLDTYLNNP